MARGRRPKQPREKLAQLWEAPEVREMGQELIEDHHSHLSGKPITYAFAGKNPGQRGCKANIGFEVVGGKHAALAQGLPMSQCPVGKDEQFFLIRVSRPAWGNWEEKQRRARLDHALSHLGVTVSGALTLWNHDIEEFEAVIHRHGLVNKAMERFAGVCAKQLGLDLPESNGKSNGHVVITGTAAAVTEALTAAAAVPAGDR